VNVQRYMVRLFSSGFADLLDRTDIDLQAKSDVLAKNAFNLRDSEQSVYEVSDGEEECLAVAAHKLTDPKHRPAAVSILRINREDLPNFGISVDHEQFGTTGVVRWDSRHLNLLASQDQLIELTRFLAARYLRGHNQLRRIEKPFVVRALNTICGYSFYHCPDHVKRIAKLLLSTNKDDWPTFARDQIEREIAAVEFDDEAIRPGAERLNSGDRLRDWFSSLKMLRDSYAKQYLPAITERFRL
jgi:hypothetical protein